MKDLLQVVRTLLKILLHVTDNLIIYFINIIYFLRAIYFRSIEEICNYSEKLLKVYY
jgi:hypothetical protein